MWSHYGYMYKQEDGWYTGKGSAASSRIPNINHVYLTKQKTSPKPWRLKRADLVKVRVTIEEIEDE